MTKQADRDLEQPGGAADDPELTDDQLKDVAGGLDLVWAPAEDAGRLYEEP